MGRKTPLSVIYSMGGRVYAVHLTTPPGTCRDKSPRILLWRGERKVLWNVGIPATQLPWLGAHKLSKPPGQCNRPPTPSHARVPKQATGTMLPPDFLPQRTLRGLDSHPCILGNAASLEQGFAVQESQYRVVLKQSVSCRAA